MLKRLIEIERRKKQKELKEKEKQERRKWLETEMGEDAEEELQEEEEEEEEEPLPEIFVPSTPCHILCGFYSEPGKFWVSLVSNNVINFYLSTNPIYLLFSITFLIPYSVLRLQLSSTIEGLDFDK